MLGPDSYIEELASTALIPDDEAGLSRSFAAKQNLSRANRLSLREVTQSNHDSRHGTSKIEHNRLANREGKVIRRVLVCGCDRLRDTWSCDRRGGAGGGVWADTGASAQTQMSKH